MPLRQTRHNLLRSPQGSLQVRAAGEPAAGVVSTSSRRPQHRAKRWRSKRRARSASALRGGKLQLPVERRVDRVSGGVGEGVGTHPYAFRLLSLSLPNTYIPSEFALRTCYATNSSACTFLTHTYRIPHLHLHGMEWFRAHDCIV